MAGNHSFLPGEFSVRMERLLGPEEAEAFFRSFEEPRTYGLRLNTAKISPEEFERIVPFPVCKIPWMENGYFYNPEDRPGKCPLYFAGLYYLQDPGAMTPLSRLLIKEGDLVCDLCAAPGGKATAAGARLGPEALLIANDVSSSRAKILLRNIELAGIQNAFVTNEQPSRLAERWAGCFDCVILDAPCSGEGMFRKEESLASDWSVEKTQRLVPIQRELLLCAVDLLRMGGSLLYSTCTYNPGEDEEAIAWLLKERPEMIVKEVSPYEGFSQGLEGDTGNSQVRKCVRVYPHKMQAEGHFFAVLEKKAEISSRVQPGTEGSEWTLEAGTKKQGEAKNRKSKKGGKTKNREHDPEKLILSFFSEMGIERIGNCAWKPDQIEIREDKAYYIPKASREGKLALSPGLRFLRHGLLLGEIKKDRFEPEETLALALRKGECRERITFGISDERVLKYLRGEPVFLEEKDFPEGKPPKSGWKLLCVEEYPLAFGKLVGNQLKNKLPLSWRQV